MKKTISFNSLFLFKTVHPFMSVMVIAVIVRLMAVLFGKGFGFDYELFSIKDTSAWHSVKNDLDRHDYGFFFVSISNLWFGVFRSVGITSALWIGFLGRLLYASLSLLTVSFGYRIADLLSNKQTAWNIAFLLAVYFVMPSFSILPHAGAFMALPLMLYGILVMLRQETLRRSRLDDNVHRTSYLVAGFFVGLSILVCGVMLPVMAGIWLLTILNRNWKSAFFSMLGAAVSVAFFMLIYWLFARMF